MHARSLFLPLILISPLAVVVAACGDDDAGDDDSRGSGDFSWQAGTGSAGLIAPESRDGAPTLDDSGGANEPSPVLASQAFDRTIIFTAGLDLEVEDIARAFNDVSRIARNHGGFVEGSSLSLRSERGVAGHGDH